MRPLRLSLTNFHGIRAGLGRDTLEIDLSAYTGLVALTGPNGTGKTTLLEQLSPYRVCPFRAGPGKYKPAQTSLYEETYGEAEKVLEWEHAGSRYRSQIFIRGALKTKKTEAYLYVHGEDGFANGWKPAVSKAGQPSDGKTETYDTLIEEILGTPEFFYTSIFACQNRRQFADYAAGEIKSLLSDLLGLDELVALSKAADEAAKHQAAKLEGLRGHVDQYMRACSERDAHVLTLGICETANATDIADRKTASEWCARAAQALAEARAQQSALDDILRRRESLTAERTRLEADHRAVLLRLAGEQTTLENDPLLAELRRTEVAADTRLQAMRSRKERLEHTLRTLPMAAATAGQLLTAESALSALDTNISDLEATVERNREWPTRLVQLRADMKAKKNEGILGREAVEETVRRGKLLQNVPCSGLTLDYPCPLLADATEAHKAEGPLTERLTTIRGEYAKMQGDLLTAESEAGAYQTAVEMLAKERARRKLLQADVDQQRERHAAAQNRGAVETQIAELDTDANLVAMELSATRGKVDARTTEVNTRRAQIETERADLIQAHIPRMVAVDAEIAKLSPDSLKAELAAAESANQTAQDALTGVDARLAKSTAALATTRANIQAAEAQIARTRIYDDQARAVSDDIAAWKLLGRGLGPNGVVALSIDDAGPSISAIANDLLLTCYGPRFSLKFETLAETRDGKAKEIFDIVTFDAERGDAKSIGKTSGGERVWLNEALTRAVGLFRVQSNAEHYQSLFTDESDGALDPERKKPFMKMKQAVLKVGGFDVEFFISHDPECQAMADHCIDLSTYRNAA